MHIERNLTGSDFFRLRRSPLLSTASDGLVLQPDNKILICSRDIDTRFLLKTFFELSSYQPLLSGSVEQSYEIIANEKPSLILLDSVLPFAQHLDNIRRIRLHKLSKRLPIIVISGFSQPRFRKLSIDAGATDFLVKPLDFDLLENNIKRFIDTGDR